MTRRPTAASLQEYRRSAVADPAEKFRAANDRRKHRIVDGIGPMKTTDYKSEDTLVPGTFDRVYRCQPKLREPNRFEIGLRSKTKLENEL